MKEIVEDGKVTKPAWKYMAVSEFVGPPEEAQAFALMDNRSSDVAEYDDEVLAGILKDLNQGNLGGKINIEDTGYSDNDLTYLLSRIEDDEIDEDTEIEDYEHEEGDTPEYMQLSEEYGDNTGELEAGASLPENYWEIKFSSTTKYEVPDLLPNMLADPPPSPIQTWPGEKYADDNFEGSWYVNWGYPSRGVDFSKSVIGFYTDDNTLMSLWNNPAKYARNFLKLKPMSVIAPGFSIWMADPFPKRLWGYYTMQFLARYYQESGLKLIPDAPVPVPKRDYNWFVDGIPRNAPCIAMQFQTGVKKNDKKAIGWYIDSIKKAIDILKPQSLLLYASKLGHTQTWNMFPSQLHVLRVATVQDVRRFRYLPDPLSSLVDSYDPKLTGKRKALKAKKLLEKEKRIEARKTTMRKKRRKNI